jgi:7-cyano-7-deazaguanine synthase
VSTAASALVLFSGGQDSATCLAWALERFDRVETVGFDYGQRHRIELDVRRPVSEAIVATRPEWRERLGADRVLDLAVLGQVSRSALTSDLPPASRDDGLPSTFVPGRNLIFLTMAAIVAAQRGLKNLVTGVCETDYSGYPDCRDDTIKALQVAVNLGMQSRLVLHAPLMWMDKAQTWELTATLGGLPLVEALRWETHSCYAGDRATRNPWGFGCGVCDACQLRAAGWTQFAARQEQAEVAMQQS